jgi:magnesium transporter
MAKPVASLSIVTQPLIRQYFRLYPAEAARVLNDLPDSEILRLVEAEPVPVASGIFLGLNPDVASRLVLGMKEDLFLRLFSAIDPVRGFPILFRLDVEAREKLLAALPPGTSKEYRELMQYAPDSAGFLMDPRVTAFHAEDTVAKALARIRVLHDRRIVDVCLIDEAGLLVAVLPLQEIAIAQPNARLGDLVSGPLVSIPAMAPRDEVVRLLEDRKLSSLPVVDFEGRLLGIIRYDAFVSLAKQEASEDVQAMFGAGRDERALSTVSLAIRKRLPWLQINLATAFLAAAVVGLFEDTIAKITALAVFLPVVAGQSGNTGSQALAVTIRGLALREIRGYHWPQIVRKEILTGFINGCAVALTTSLVVYLWIGSYGLPLVIGTSMIFSMVIAGLAGAVIPMMLKALGQDPAQSSSIILTTVTDVFGFLSFLGLARFLSTMLIAG